MPIQTKNNLRPKWFSTGYLKAKPSGEVNDEKGIIEGVSVCTVGEAKGHGVHLDSEFVARVAELGASKKQGLKARFGHPNMCSTALGTFIGRFKNFRVVGEQSKADLFLSNEAKETPHGNLRAYVLGMARNEPDMFGTSIVFTPGREYKRDAKGEKIYAPGWSPDDDETGDEYRERRDRYENTAGPVFIECEELHACDTVDDPAANDGLFSKFSGETVAGQITEFLDLNPQVWEIVQQNPSVLEALGRYGDKLDEFITRYRAYRSKQSKEQGHMKKEATGSEQTATVTVTETVTLGDASHEVKTEVKPTEKATAEPVAAEVKPVEVAPVGLKADPVATVDAKPPEGKVEEVKLEKPELSREEFIKIADQFGDAIAVQVVRNGGDFASAQALSLEAVKKENEMLRKQLAERAEVVGGSPAQVVSAKKPAKLFSTGK